MAIDFTKSKSAVTTNLPDNTQQLITAGKVRTTLNQLISDTETSMNGIDVPGLNTINDKLNVHSSQINSLQLSVNGMNAQIDSLNNSMNFFGPILTGMTGQMQDFIEFRKEMNQEIQDFYERTDEMIDDTENVNQRSVKNEERLDAAQKYIEPILLEYTVSNLLQFNISKNYSQMNFNDYTNNKYELIVTKGSDKYTMTSVYESKDMICFMSYTGLLTFTGIKPMGEFSYDGTAPWL